MAILYLLSSSNSEPVRRRRSIFSSNEEPSTFSDDLVFETFVVGSGGTSSAIMVIFSEVRRGLTFQLQSLQIHFVAF
jgi:hypothetical protein